MEEARRRDTSGHERLRKEKLIIDDERETAEKVERRRQRKEDRRENCSPSFASGHP